MKQWNEFTPGIWQEEINVRDFIQKNYTPYDGNEEFLTPATERTLSLRKKLDELLQKERENGGAYKVDTRTAITPTAFAPGYLDKEQELIVGLQTDEPLKRACNPFGGMRMVREACAAYGHEVSPELEEEFLLIRLRFVPRGIAALSPVCQTLTAVAALLGITVG